MFTFIFSKIGAYVVGGLLIAALMGGGYLYITHLQSVNAAQKVQIEQLQAANDFYAKQPEIDQATQEVQDEIKKAVDSGDVERVRALYLKLRQHQRDTESKTSSAADDGDNE